METGLFVAGDLQRYRAGRRWGNHLPRLVRKSFSSRPVAPKQT
jgi:hypothetical protein